MSAIKSRYGGKYSCQFVIETCWLLAEIKKKNTCRTPLVTDAIYLITDRIDAVSIIFMLSSRKLIISIIFETNSKLTFVTLDLYNVFVM